MYIALSSTCRIMAFRCFEFEMSSSHISQRKPLAGVVTAAMCRILNVICDWCRCLVGVSVFPLIYTEALLRATVFAPRNALPLISFRSFIAITACRRLDTDDVPPSLRRWAVYRPDEVDDQQLVRAKVFKYVSAFKP